MKKVLLISALAVAAMANAINPQALQKFNASEAKQITTEVLPFEWKDVTTLLKEHDAARAPKADSVAYGLADWYYAPGSFHLGMYEGLGGYNLAFTLFPYLDSVVYKNYYGPTNWTVNGTSAADSTDTYVTGYGLDGLYYMPQTADHTFNPKRDWGSSYKDTTIAVKGTLYGSATNYQYVASAISSKFLNDENIYMTLCAMETDPFNDPDGDFWRVGGPQTATGKDPYYNGTGIHLDSTANTADTLGIIVDNQGLMKIEQILWPLYSDGTTALANMIPDNAKLQVNIFPLNGNKIDLKDTLASAVMTNADFVGNAASWGMYGTLHTKFYETDIFDQKMQVPVWINGPFYLQLTNFNETGCNFGIFSDYYCPTTATTVYQYKGKFAYRGGKGGGGNYGQNLGVSFDAYWPTLVTFASTTMNAPVAGGEAVPSDDEEPGAILYANVNPNDWEIDFEEEWIEVAIDTAYYADYGAGIVYVNAEALPSDISSRTATVEVNADGNIIVLTIAQGEGQGIENTKVNAAFENKSYDLLGREIKNGKNFNGVIIRNGKKTLSK